VSVGWKDWIAACSLGLAAGVTLGAVQAADASGAGSTPRLPAISTVSSLPVPEDDPALIASRQAPAPATGRGRARVTTPTRERTQARSTATDKVTVKVKKHKGEREDRDKGGHD